MNMMQQKIHTSIPGKKMHYQKNIDDVTKPARFRLEKSGGICRLLAKVDVDVLWKSAIDFGVTRFIHVGNESGPNWNSSPFQQLSIACNKN